MKEQAGYCFWYGCTMEQITEEEQEECDYANGDCSDCENYRENQS